VIVSCRQVYLGDRLIGPTLDRDSSTPFPLLLRERVSLYLGLLGTPIAPTFFGRLFRGEVPLCRSNLSHAF